ncbi:MAG: nuclear transport factor 2 family protein [Acidobacteriia bacterium]|nr:nuclear transport factor 2 family protein [Terriglobia bacterium]
MNYLDLRKTMRAGVPVVIVLLTLALTASAQDTKSPPTARQLSSLLNQFLDAAGRGDRAVFDRFFADDVIYTRSAGVTVDKAKIMKNIGRREDAGAKNTFSADDVTIHDYGTTAVVNFRLTARTEKAGKSETAHYRNTATFLKRNGHWQVVAWQATKVPGEKRASIN